MKCQQCGENDGKMTIKRIVLGQLIEQTLCVECARAYEKPELSTLFSEEGLLHHLMDAMDESVIKIEHVVSLRCPKCGLTFSGYKKMRKLGCACCYTTFEDKLMDWIKRYHGSDEHRGIRPEIGQNDIVLHQEALLDELRQAVQIEDYERAAALRDQLKRGGVSHGK